MKGTSKKLLAVILSVMLVISLLPAVAFGEEEPVAVPADATQLMHNIAAEYAQKGAAGDGNAPWIIADMMAYEKAFPDSQYKLSEDQKLAMVDEAIDCITKEGATVKEQSKYIIALCGMGFDARDLTTSTGQKMNGVKLLLTQSFDENAVSEEIKDVYTIPWVMLALKEYGSEYADQISALKKELLQEALEDGGWGYSYDGTDFFDPDGTAFALLALAPFMEEEDTGIILGKAEDAIKRNVILDESGAVFSWGTSSPESTALLIMGLAALGKDPTLYFQGKNLVEGLTSLQNENGNGFPSQWDPSTATEQGFRGLIVASQAKNENQYWLYDFSQQTLAEAKATPGNVAFEVTPENATVTVIDSEGNTANPTDGGYLYYFDKPGKYNYTVSCAGYNTKTGSVDISEEDLSNYVKKTETVSLTKESSSTGSSKVRVTVQILAHDGEKCENTVTYKNDPDSYYSILKKDSYTAVLEKNEGTGEDAVIEALQDSNVNYTKQSNGYFSSIGGYTEASHGSSSGWLYLVNGKSGTSSLNNVTFSKNGTITMFFTDDFMKDFGSEGWAPAPDDGKDDPSDKPDDPTDKGYYDDTVGHWAEDAINKVTDRGWMNGVADRKFAPDTTLSRAMFVTMLYRLEDSPSQSAAQTALPEGGSQEVESKFSDVEKDSWYEEAVAWAVANDIVKGTSETTFSPNANVTREQMAAFLSRYTESKDSPSQSAAQTALPNEESQGGLDRYLDKDQISDWALESMSWAVGQGLINGVTENQLQPKGTATRAQAATILIRFDERILQSN